MQEISVNFGQVFFRYLVRGEKKKCQPEKGKSFSLLKWKEVLRR